jgi:hypothetical protein
MTVGDPLRLSRRDRKALELAYDWLLASLGRNRSGVRKHRVSDAAWTIEMAMDTMDLGGDVCDEIRHAMRGNRGNVLRYPPRLLRVRAALLLRAILRADAGDFGMVTGRVCCECGVFWPRKAKPDHDHYDHAAGHLKSCRGAMGRGYSGRSSRRYTPLWASAPTRAR